jgi:ABC-type sugar transport system ATPase subunit
MAPLLQLSDIHKSYGAHRVLHGVRFSIEPGEIVSLIGENGAGKSTLAKIIAGVTQPDTGLVQWKGSPIEFASPVDAINAGIGIVHQEISLVDTLSISENISLGREPRRWGLLDTEAMLRRAMEALKTLDCDLDPICRVGTLTSAQKQLVEIARAIAYDARLLIFDEPTSSLSEREGEILLNLIRSLAAQGVSIVYVSHRLSEVQSISNRVVALRDGANSGEASHSNLDRENLISLIVGREIKDLFGYTPRPRGESRLTLDGFQATPWHAPVNLTVHAGEILGIAGLIGSGRSELLEAIAGITQPLAGTVTINGSAQRFQKPAEALQAGLALVPENRKEQGIVSSFSISDSIALARAAYQGYLTPRSREAEINEAIEKIQSLGVRCSGPEQAIGTLSGGNQQKVVLARCLASSPSILLLDEPTRGVDVGARRELYAILFSLAARGMALLVVSSELEEVLGISDRVVVMCEGAITGELARADFSEHAVMGLAAPQTLEAA